MTHHRDVHSEPNEYLSEISADGYEFRKVAYYDDGRIEWADTNGGRGKLTLRTEKVPPFSMLRAHEEFYVEEVTLELFEQRWAEAIANSHRPFLLG
ncbi:hypothetical protein [Kitasatospora sp. NBC_00315]|uniref:DUF6881 domain-containing protein n=1 Tax=Kitasatospora sp. NBC_00315 TaxID=2975963 RepID=UPI00352D4E7D